MPIITCPACGGAIPDGARFCPSCGRPVSVAGGEERKLATIVFADLTDSSQLATRMDAEALRALLADVYDQLSQVVASFGGTVEKFIGDAIMAVFGVPTAHEDDPERAVRAALGMRSRLTGIARRHGQDLILRVGVNTGVVATGSDIGRDFLVTGDAVNVAARLQQAAEPGEVLVGDRTFRALQPLVQTVQPRTVIVQGPRGRHPGPRGRAHRALDRVPAAPVVGPVRRPVGRAVADHDAVRPRRRAPPPAHGHRRRRAGDRQEPAGRGGRDRAAVARRAAPAVGLPLPSLRRGRRLPAAGRPAPAERRGRPVGERRGGAGRGARAAAGAGRRGLRRRRHGGAAHRRPGRAGGARRRRAGLRRPAGARRLAHGAGGAGRAGAGAAGDRGRAVGRAGAARPGRGRHLRRPAGAAGRAGAGP